MKLPKIIFLSLFLLALTAAFGQKAKTAASNDGSVIKKGYYSIGNHSEKLQTPQQLSADITSSPVVTKGFYSIKSNEKNLSKKSGWYHQPPSRPVSNKGYYSIGNNGQKQ